MRPASASPRSAPARCSSLRAGLLNGRPATTHHDAFDDLEAAGARVLRDARVVDDGDIVSSGGVMAGIDMALWLVEQELGPEVAAAGEQRIEHRRDRRVWQAARA